MNIFSKLDQILDLTNNEKTLVNYIKQYPYEVIHMDIDTLCKTCFISKSTIYRLCKKLNIDGYLQLKVEISSNIGELKKDRIDYDFPIQSNQTQYEIVHSLESVYKNTLNETVNLMDLDALRKSASLLKKAKVIDIYTSAGNLYFARNFKFQMEEIGRQVNVPSDEYEQHLQASTSTSDKVAIVISFGGRGRVLHSVMAVLKETKTPIILIASTKDNPIKKIANEILYMASNEDHFNKISSFATRLTLLFILDSLYSCFFKLDYERNKKYKMDTYQRMQKYPKDYSL